MSRRLTNKDQVIEELLRWLHRIDAELDAHVVDSAGDLLYD